MQTAALHPQYYPSATVQSPCLKTLPSSFLFYQLDKKQKEEKGRNRCVNSNAVCSPGLTALSEGRGTSAKRPKQILTCENPITA